MEFRLGRILRIMQCSPCVLNRCYSWDSFSDWIAGWIVLMLPCVNLP